jgi:predicted nuclease of predicted toxin-antitoxin system
MIWTYAGANGFLLVTKDEDFHRLSVLLGPPPKVVWIGLGNCSTADVAGLLRDRHGAIVQFVEHPEAAFLAGTSCVGFSRNLLTTFTGGLSCR